MINIKHIGILFIGLCIAGVIIYAKPEQPVGGEIDITPAVLSKQIDNKEVDINYTDDNTGETLIIRTDQSDFWNWGGSITTYFSVQNISGKDQFVDIAFSFPREHQPEVWEYSGETVIDGYYIPALPQTATSTPIPIYVEPTTETNWSKLGVSNFQAKTHQRKATGKARALKENTVFIKTGETKFFKARVNHITEGREEFFIEAFGSLGDYGHLDPWTVEDLFNSDTKSTGDLNGQDGWSGGTAWDVINTDMFEGDQSIVNVASNDKVSIVVSGLTSGTWYYAFKITTTGSGNVWTFWEDNDNVNAIALAHGTELGGLKLMYFDTGYNEIQDITADTWYVAKIVYNGGANNFTIDVWTESVGWSGVSGNLSCRGTCAEIDGLQIWGGLSKTFRIDTITPTDPTPAVAVAGEVSNSQVIIQF